MKTSSMQYLGSSTIIAGGILLILTFVAEAITQLIAPYDMFSIGGMRSITDPIMWLFFLYPFLFALVSAIGYHLIKLVMPEGMILSGLWFAGFLFLFVIIPNIFVIFTSMTYPAGFYLSNILTAAIGYPIIGMVFYHLDERFGS